MKKIFKVIAVASLTCFSFYYTHKAIMLSNQTDPIMQTINTVSKDYEIPSVNAKINEDTITPGICGIEVDKDESYYKMKRLGEYNENLLLYKNILPEISIANNYDKYITNGNRKNKKVVLSFILNNDKYIETIFNILKEKQIKAVFFIDGMFLENNKQLIIDNKDIMYLENYGYNNEYDKTKIDYTKRLVEQLTNNKTKFCLTKSKDSQILSSCSSTSHYTILPTIISNTNPYYDIKETLKNGAIFLLDTNKYTTSSLRQIITFIEQKGYDITSLSNIIDECA